MTRADRVLYGAVKAARLREAFKGNFRKVEVMEAFVEQQNKAEALGWELQNQRGKLSVVFKDFALVTEHKAPSSNPYLPSKRDFHGLGGGGDFL